jgi:hypothetical protein
MKKLVLLQLLLLPLGGLLDVTSAAEPAAMRCEQPSAVERVEHQFSGFAKRLIGASYAQSPRAGFAR